MSHSPGTGTLRRVGPLSRPSLLLHKLPHRLPGNVQLFQHCQPLTDPHCDIHLVCCATAVLPVGALGGGGEVLVGIVGVKGKSDMHTVVADVIDRGLKIGVTPQEASETARQ